ncbi:MAG: DUF3021 domain-containing protein [Cellulosilyticaceae bacterium]
MLSQVFKKIIIGISFGCTIFTFMLFFAKAFGADTFFQMVTEDYLTQALCCILVATVFTVLGVAYEYDRLSYPQQILIHMGGGLIVYFMVAYFAHWLPIEAGVAIVLSAIILMVAVSFLIWFGFHLYYRAEAKRMNAKISERTKH